MVCQHGPEATQRFGGDPRSEHGNIALQIGADEISSPSLAQPVAGCNETFRKTTTCPEPIEFSVGDLARVQRRSEEHTSELQSLMRISYAVFCLKKKKTQ